MGNDREREHSSRKQTHCVPESKQTSLPGGRIHKRTQKVAKLKSQVGDHDGEQNGSILATVPQNLECETLIYTEFAKSQILIEGAKL